MRAELAAFRGLGRNVRLFLFASSLVGLAVFGGIYPVLFNLYLLRLGYGPEFVGLVSAVSLLAYALSCPPAGAIGSRWGVRRAMIVGMGLMMAGFVMQPLCEFVPTSWRSGWLVGAGILAYVGLGLYLTNANPFLMGSTGGHQRTHAYAARSALSLSAGFVGSLVAGVLPAALASLSGATLSESAPFRWPLLLAALLLGPGLIALMRTEPVHLPVPVPEEHQPRAGAPVGIILLLALVDFLVLTSEGVTRTFTNVYLDVGLGASTAAIGGLFSVAQLVAIPAVFVAPLLCRRWGTGMMVAICSLGMALWLLPVALIPSEYAAALSYTVVITLAQIRVAVVAVYQMERVEPIWRPTMSGAVGLALGLSWSATSLGGGYIITHAGYRFVFGVCAGLAIVGSLAFVLPERRRLGLFQADVTRVNRETD